MKVDTVPTINSVIDDRTINHFETFANLNDDIEGKTHLEVLAADVTLDLSLPFVIGDLVWAYISGYPLWPSLITQDPIEFLYTKTRSKILFHLKLRCIYTCYSWQFCF